MNIKTSTIDQINFARTHPERYSLNLLNKFKPNFNGNQLCAFGKKIEMFEGLSSVEDLYKDMKERKSQNFLKESPLLSKIATQIATYKGMKGETCHESPLSIVNRICQKGLVKGKIGELIGLSLGSPDEIVSYFLVDDGLASRKRRKMLLNGIFNHVGIGVSNHSKYSSIVVILLCEEVHEQK